MGYIRQWMSDSQLLRHNSFSCLSPTECPKELPASELGACNVNDGMLMTRVSVQLDQRDVVAMRHVAPPRHMDVRNTIEDLEQQKCR